MTNGYTNLPANNRAQTNSNNNDKTSNGETIYTTRGVVEFVFVVPIKQNTEEMYVVGVKRPGKSAVFVKILGKTRDTFKAANIQVGEEIRCRAYYPKPTAERRDFGFDLPHPEYGSINVQTQIALYANRPMTDEEVAAYKADKAAKAAEQEAAAMAGADNGIG